MKKIALPSKFRNADGSIRTDLSAEEQVDIQKYTIEGLSAEETAAREAEYESLLQAEATQARDAALLKCRKQAAENYPYGGIVIKLDEGVRADLTAYFLSLQAGALPEDFVLPWSERGYEGTAQETILIAKADLSAFCLGARAQRENAFRAYAALAPDLATYATAEDVEAAFAATFATLTA